jgi:hypothetical protein
MPDELVVVVPAGTPGRAVPRPRWTSSGASP